MLRVLCSLTILLLLAACAPASSPSTAATSIPTPTPTPRPRAALPRSAALAMQLPGQVEQLALAVHPQDGWPALGAVSYWNFGGDPARFTVRAYDPAAHAWGPARQLDTGPASLGGDAFHGGAVGIGPEGEIVAAWGASDADGGLWASESADAGQTWTEPARIATNCWHVRSVVVAPSGEITVLAFCVATTRDQHGTSPVIITRTADGRWLPLVLLPVIAWDGALVQTATQLVALVVPQLGGDQPHVGTVLTQPLDQPGAPWRIQSVPLVPPGLSPDVLGLYAWHVAGVATPQGALFTYTGYDRASVFALRVVDGEAQPPVAVVSDTESSRARVRFIWYGVPASDPATGALVTLWGCCGSPIDPAPTHLYGAWSADGTVWHAPLQTAPVEEGGPLLLDQPGRLEALASAQAPDTRAIWLASVVDGQTVQAQLLPLDQLVPPQLEVQP
ncbi:MAG TPA: hypothetical protein VFS21_30045 [Roseiflexaceae bacterium]|nr:hypothetical protein [Roseiflexaceae bacterium]